MFAYAWFILTHGRNCHNFVVIFWLKIKINVQNRKNKYLFLITKAPRVHFNKLSDCKNTEHVMWVGTLVQRPFPSTLTHSAPLLSSSRASWSEVGTLHVVSVSALTRQRAPGPSLQRRGPRPPRTCVTCRWADRQPSWGPRWWTSQHNFASRSIPSRSSEQVGA